LRLEIILCILFLTVADWSTSAIKNGRVKQHLIRYQSLDQQCLDNCIHYWR